MSDFDKQTGVMLTRGCPSCGAKLTFDLYLTAQISEADVAREGIFGFSREPEPYAPEMPNLSGFPPFFEVLGENGQVAGLTNGCILFYDGIAPKSLRRDVERKRRTLFAELLRLPTDALFLEIQETCGIEARLADKDGFFSVKVDRRYLDVIFYFLPAARFISNRSHALSAAPGFGPSSPYIYIVDDTDGNLKMVLAARNGAGWCFDDDD